jgi:hypothetical protein
MDVTSRLNKAAGASRLELISVLAQKQTWRQASAKPATPESEH